MIGGNIVTTAKNHMGDIGHIDVSGKVVTWVKRHDHDAIDLLHVDHVLKLFESLFGLNLRNQLDVIALSKEHFRGSREDACIYVYARQSLCGKMTKPTDRALVACQRGLKLRFSMVLRIFSVVFLPTPSRWFKTRETEAGETPAAFAIS